MDHSEILATGRSDVHRKIKETLLIRICNQHLMKMLAASRVCRIMPA